MEKVERKYLSSYGLPISNEICGCPCKNLSFHFLKDPQIHSQTTRSERSGNIKGSYSSKLEIRVSQNLAKLGGGWTAKISDGVGRDRISGLTGEVELHGHNGSEI